MGLLQCSLYKCHETAYYIGENGYLRKNTNQVLEIWRKYNSEQLVAGILNKLQQL